MIVRSPFQRLSDSVERASPEDREAILFHAAIVQSESHNSRTLLHLTRAALQAGMTVTDAERIIRQAIFAAAKEEAAK